ncbi:MAG: multicomponent Na+:H+ antiporter subunit E [Acidimicrobiales bacterium]|jgi:multicomponent Na+:H+ antiporter subunit E
MSQPGANQSVLASNGRGRPRLLTARGVAMITMLTAVWCALWQTISFANVAGGMVLSTLVLTTGLGTPTTGAIRVDPMVRLLWVVFVDLVTSTIDVAKEILTPTDNTDEAIIAVEIPREGRHHLLLLIIAVTLTPGTAVVDADPDTGTLYLHLLHSERSDDVVEHVQQLTALACQALPVPTVTRPLQSTP